MMTSFPSVPCKVSLLFSLPTIVAVLVVASADGKRVTVVTAITPSDARADTIAIFAIDVILVLLVRASAYKYSETFSFK
jgi:hypothetical protein